MSAPVLKLVPTARTSTPRPGRRSAQAVPGVITQIRIAFRPQARLALFVGALLGGFVPMATYTVAHFEIDRALPLWQQPATMLVIGGLLFSARTVFAWAKGAFADQAKALGWVILAEGVLILSTHWWLSSLALGFLVGINGIATGCTLALERSAQ